jgi:hypothetical protein
MGEVELPKANCPRPEQCPLALGLSCLVKNLDARVTAMQSSVDALMDIVRGMPGNRPTDPPLRFADLRPDQVSMICNGCGAKGGWFNPPDWIFEADCNRHDFAYWRGGDEAARRKADRGFYEAMQADASRLPVYDRWLGHLAAWTYYRAVRAFGAKHFHYAPTPRGRADLAQIAP